MRINIKEVLKDYRGRGMETVDGDNKKEPMTVRIALNAAVNGVVILNGQVVPLTAEDKGRIYQLSTKLWSAKKEVDLTVDEMAFIKKRAGQVSNINPLLNGRICDLLEGKDAKKKS